MIKVHVFTFLLFCTFCLFSQEYNRKITDPKTSKEVLIGYCTREGLFESDFNQYFEKSYEAYQFDHVTIDNINMLIENVKIVVIMGIWCEDSQREIPVFYKIIDHLIIPVEHVTLICVDSQKKAKGVDLDPYKFQKIPTFIIYKNDVELGRIVEKPVVSLEKDMLKILKSDK